MFQTKEQIQELCDTLDELDVWNMRASKNNLIKTIENHRLYDKRLGETPESVLNAFIQWQEEQESDNYYYSKLSI